MAFPPSLSQEQKDRIAKRLRDRKVPSSCPMCGHNKFVLADGFFNNSVQTNFEAALVLGGPSIPTIALICSNCGFISQHALGVLGLLEEGGIK